MCSWRIFLLKYWIIQPCLCGFLLIMLGHSWCIFRKVIKNAKKTIIWFEPIMWCTFKVFFQTGLLHVILCALYIFMNVLFCIPHAKNVHVHYLNVLNNIFLLYDAKSIWVQYFYKSVAWLVSLSYSCFISWSLSVSLGWVE